MNQKLQGITLRATDFKERQRIVTLLTPEMGVISVMVYGVGSKNLSTINLTSPLTMAEWIIKPARGELWRHVDASILHIPMGIRHNLPRLQAAQQILSQILSTQLPHKPSPELYTLVKSFLKRLNTSTNPHNLSIAFRLKFLRHEGLLCLDSTTWGAASRTVERLALSRSFEDIEQTLIDENIYHKLDSELCRTHDGITRKRDF